MSLPLSQYSKDLSYLNRWLDYNEMTEYSDMSFADVKNLLSELEFSLRNMNDSLLKGFDDDGKMIFDPSRWMRDHEGKLDATLTESDVENLVSDMKKLQELRDILGAMLGLENEPNAIQTKIKARRKYLDKVGVADYAPWNDDEMSLESLKKSRKWFEKALSESTEEDYSYYSKRLYEVKKRERSLKKRQKLPEMEEEVAKLDSMEGKELTLELKTIGLDGVKKRIKELQDMLADTNIPMNDEQRKEVVRLQNQWKAYEKTLKKSSVTLQGTWGSIKGVGGGVESITTALQGNGNAWQTITGFVDGAIQAYEGISSIISIIQTLTAATGTATAAENAKTQATAAGATASAASTAATTANTAASAANTAAKSGEAIAGATASGAKMPFPLNLVAIAAGVAAVIGALAMISGAFAEGGVVPGSSYEGDKLLARVNSGEMILNRKQQARLFAMLGGVPKFANGGLVYGPTLALMGEYAGAKSNPEVIAPLDRLKGLIGGGTGGSGTIKMKLKGRQLVGVLANETRINRRPTNIHL